MAERKKIKPFEDPGWTGCKNFVTNIYKPQAEWNQVVDMITIAVIDYFMPKLSASAWKILSSIINHTLIKRKRNVPVSYAQLQKMCGRGVQSSATINRAIQELLGGQYLIRLPCPTQNIYVYRLNISKLMQISAREKAYRSKEQAIQEAKQAYIVQKRRQFQACRPQIASNLLRRDNYQCQYCGAKENLTVDHIVPISKGGHPTDPANLVIACQSCNSRKGDRIFLSRKEIGYGETADG